ncbi:nucleolar protein 6 [Halyomorpha halys]|uniref:nucleolar protein 6 n=1 Tax=Halyomorpha halys TaxID=286706 RepID=UPI0006D4E621|nr:nucleolar protein 6 [Halyomorpha halys]
MTKSVYKAKGSTFTVEEVKNIKESYELKSDESEQDDGYDDSDSNEEDEITEELEEKKTSKKRKLEDGEKLSSVSKKAKRKGKVVKPPTAEEMVSLRETETLFQSNLFKLQIDEMLSELKPKKSVKRHIPSWLENFKKVLMNLSDQEEPISLDDTKWVEDLNIILPFKRKKEVEKGTFKFMKPVDVFTTGSYDLLCPLGPMFSLDIGVVMPKKFFQKIDNLNQRYHLKRVLYLCYIASKLDGSDLISSEVKMHFSSMSGDSTKPLLTFRPSGKLSNYIEVKLFPVPEMHSFFYKRFVPFKNNVRAEWWGAEIEGLQATQFYNASILEDLVLKENHDFKKSYFETNQHLREAFVLMRVWLKQQELNQGFGSFNSHITAMMMVYLIKIGKINKHMSSYQIIRHIWMYLAETDWTVDGPSLCSVEDNDIPTKDIFHLHYDVVFIDTSGFFNIASRLNKYVYQKVKEEAAAAMKHLDNYEINNFKVLFMTKMPFLRQYDTVICFKDIKTIQNTVQQKGDPIRIMDSCGNPVTELIRLVTDVLERGMGHRISSIGVQTSPKNSWELDSEPPSFVPISIGIMLNHETALSLIDKGPQSNEAGAEEFREFWGDKCDLRRFKDGTVCESVVWGDAESTVEYRRGIVNKIVSYLLNTKLDMKFPIIPSEPFQLVTACKSDGSTFKREEECRKVHLAFEDLARQLRDLPDLPLQVVSVHCISPVYRFTDPFPPEKPFFRKNIAPFVNDPVKGRIFPEDGKFPYQLQYISPIDLVLQLSVTQKWPDDVKAGKRLITAFNIAISAALKKKCNLSFQLTTDYIVVNKDGYLFRLFLGYSKEIGLLKLKITELGVKQYTDTPESLELEKKFINLPKITGALYRLSEEHSSFSPAACLAKRWFSSQLVDSSHFPTILIELLMASLYLTPQPFNISLSVLPTFLRFLNLISTTDWAAVPIIVNLNHLLSKEEIIEIEDAFTKERTNYPTLFLATPYDKSGSLWSRTAPTLPTLIRLAKLAATSLQIIEKNILKRDPNNSIYSIFQPPMSCYDAVIKLNKKFQYRHGEAFKQDLPPKRFSPKFDRNPVLPILEFNPIDLYVTELRTNYSDFALFFYNTHGGVEIGVLFKPDFLKRIDFKVTSINGRKPLLGKDKLMILEPNIEGILEGFKILGGDIVESVDLKSKVLSS